MQSPSNPNECNAVNINHSVSAVGIKNVTDPTDGVLKPCLIIQNSWGTGHGEGGYEYVLIEEGAGFGGIFQYGYMYTVEMEKLAIHDFTFDKIQS